MHVVIIQSADKRPNNCIFEHPCRILLFTLSSSTQ